jgi:GT2 family glycosyltransferase
MILHIIIAAYKKAIATRGLIDSFINQTNKNWVVYAVHDGPPEDDYKAIQPLYDKEPRVGFYNSEVKFGCNGHLNRRMMLEGITGADDDFVLITNCDNYYIPYFVDYMLRECRRDVGIVYCDTLHSHQNYAVQVSKLVLSGIDMGAFIVRLPVAQENGFNHCDYLPADGLFAEECAALSTRKGLRCVHVPIVLFVHN